MASDRCRPGRARQAQGIVGVMRLVSVWLMFEYDTRSELPDSNISQNQVGTTASVI